MNDLQEIPVLLKDLELFRTTMLAVQTFLEAQDMAKCQLNMWDTKFSPLTQDVQHGVKRIEGLIGDYLVQQHFDETMEIATEVEQELEPLSENPMMTKRLPKARKMVKDGAERVEPSSE
jgi:hypothetical protein